MWQWASPSRDRSREARLRQETMDGSAQSAADNYPESTLDEWNAFFEVFITDLDALRQERCANSQ